MRQMNLFTKQTHRLREQAYGCWEKRMEKRMVREFGMDRYPLLYLNG